MTYKLAPIALFLYKKIDEAKLVINALENNLLSDKSILYIFIDGPKAPNEISTTNELLYLANGVSGFLDVRVILAKQNKGLSRAVIEGVSEILKNHEKVIIVEDDLVTNKYFLKFINDCLNVFENRSDIVSVSGFSYESRYLRLPKNYYCDLYLSRRASSHGWGTWANRWECIDWDINRYFEKRNEKDFRNRVAEAGSDIDRMMVDQFNGKIDSWAVRFVLHQLEHNLYTVYPKCSLVCNIGFGDSATHTKRKNGYLNTKLKEDWFPRIIDQDLGPNKEILKRWPHIFKSKRRFKLKNIKKQLKII